MPIPDEFRNLISLTRAKHTSRIKSSSFFALLLMLLWWQTRWPSLHWGLSILLLGQLGAALALVYANSRLAPPDLQPADWLENQRRFETALYFFENVTRAVGFLFLAWGFWEATQNLPVAVILGVVYPAFVYWGVARKNYVRTMARLRADLYM